MPLLMVPDGQVRAAGKVDDDQSDAAGESWRTRSSCLC